MTVLWTVSNLLQNGLRKDRTWGIVLLFWRSVSLSIASNYE